MHIALVGSGPVGMTASLLLARRGHRVSVIDRDPGPQSGSPWERVGVGQFHLAHGFRSGCRQLLLDRLPDVYRALLRAGAVVEEPDDPERRCGIAVRRAVLEQTLWQAVTAEPGILRITGHADRIQVKAGRVTGVVVDGRTVPADVVIDASGRAGRISHSFRPPARSVDCGMAYASRVYQLLPGAEPEPAGGVFVSEENGYQYLIFPSDAGTFTVLVVRLADDRDLMDLRETDAFEAAVRLLPAARAWTDPTRARPIDKVRAGAGLVNTYRPQPSETLGLLAVGDAVCATNPMGGRGVTLGLESAAAMVDLMSAQPIERWSAGLDAWCSERLYPWFLDHVEWDALIRDSWSGGRIDPDGPLGLNLLVAAARERPHLFAELGPYLDMVGLPASTNRVRAEVREMLRSGWRPPAPTTPAHETLVAAVRSALGQDLPRWSTGIGSSGQTAPGRLTP